VDAETAVEPLHAPKIAAGLRVHVEMVAREQPIAVVAERFALRVEGLQIGAIIEESAGIAEGVDGEVDGDAGGDFELSEPDDGAHGVEMAFYSIGIGIGIGLDWIFIAV